MKNILITGASRGVGKACAQSFANKDTHLILISKSNNSIKDVVEFCEGQGAKVTKVICDLSNDKEIKAHFKLIKQNIQQIDLLINNAGLWLEDNFEQGNMSLWDEILDVNLKAPIHITKNALEIMKEGSAIIFINSIAARKTYAGGTNYCAGKWGLLGFANSLFEDIRNKGIKVTSILPGVINTDMHAKSDFIKENMLQPEDIAQTIKYVIDMPLNACPTEITLMPQKNHKK